MNHFAKALLCGTAVTLLGGCSLWNNYKHPDTPTAEAWSTQLPADDAAVWPDADWWKHFNSPELSKQIDEALKANYDLKAAVARVREADAQVRISGAALLPSVDATAGASRDRTPAATRGSVTTINGVSAGSKARIANSYNAGLNASYEIDFWGKNWATKEAAQALADASRYDHETVLLTVTSSVAGTYFDILATRERIGLAADNLNAASQLLDDIKKRFNQGIGTALDVAQQESVVASERAAIPPLALHLRQSLDAQAILLAKLPEAIEMPPEKLGDIAVPTPGSGVAAELLTRRPDVQNAEAQLRSNNADIIAARAAFFPSITLNAQGGYESSVPSLLLRPDSMLWSLGSSLAQPIFEGGLLRGELNLAKARTDEALQNYQKTAISAYGDVEDALIAVQQDSAEEDAQLYAMQTAQQAYDLTKQQLGGGIIDITTVLNTQRTLFSAQDAYIQARLAHLQAIVGLYRALGGGWKA